MDELRKEKNRLALEKIELLDRITSYNNREDLSAEDKKDALEELNERLEVLEKQLIETRQAYNTAVSQDNYKTNSLKYEQMRNRRESEKKYEEGQAKYQQMREEKKAKEDLIFKFISQNQSARNEFMKGASLQDISAKHAGEIEAFERNMANSADVSVQPEVVQNDAENSNSEITLEGIEKGTVDDNLAAQAMVTSFENLNKQGAGERPVYADPDNVKDVIAVDNEQSDTDAVDIEPEVADQETVESTKKSAPMVGSNESESSDDAKTDEKSNVKMSVIGDKGHEVVSKIRNAFSGKDDKLLGKIAMTAGLAVAALVTIPIVAPFIANVGTVAAAGLAIDGYYNFNKGRKL